MRTTRHGWQFNLVLSCRARGFTIVSHWQIDYQRKECVIMCLLIFAHRVWPGQPLVLAANRDEFYERETAASTFWPEHPDLLAGKDLRQGGTWMGITRSGYFAAITNYRDPASTRESPRSRGELPLDFLIGAATPGDYLQQIAKLAPQYAGFNLLLGDGQDLWYFNNRSAGHDQQSSRPHKLPPGIYGLSNANLDTPWPKVELGKQRLTELIASNALSHEALIGVVNNRQRAARQALAQQGMETEMEQVLSAQFIQAGTYGTRSSTTMWADENGTVSWRELSFDSLGVVQETREEHFETLQGVATGL